MEGNREGEPVKPMRLIVKLPKMKVTPPKEKKENADKKKDKEAQSSKGQQGTPVADPQGAAPVTVEAPSGPAASPKVAAEPEPEAAGPSSVSPAGQDKVASEKPDAVENEKLEAVELNRSSAEPKGNGESDQPDSAVAAAENNTINNAAANIPEPGKVEGNSAPVLDDSGGTEGAQCQQGPSAVVSNADAAALEESKQAEASGGAKAEAAATEAGVPAQNEAQISPSAKAEQAPHVDLQAKEEELPQEIPEAGDKGGVAAQFVAPLKQEGASAPQSGAVLGMQAGAEPPQSQADDKMDVDVKKEPAATSPSKRLKQQQANLTKEENVMIQSSAAANVAAANSLQAAASVQAAQAAAVQAAAAQAAAAGAVQSMTPDASFYQVLRMQAAQAQAEAQAQAVQAAQAQAAQQVGSPIVAGKTAPANVQVPYMSMPPQLQAMQLPEGFLMPQQMMVQAAQAHAQAQAQAQAQAHAQAHAQAQAQARAQHAARSRALNASENDGKSKKRKTEKQDKGPGKAPPKKKKVSNKEKLTQKDAIKYLTEVKERFKEKPNVYNKFLDIMKKFRMNKIDTQGVVDLVKTLFKGHKDLLLGFNTFVPSGYEIRVGGPAQKKADSKKKPPSKASKKDKKPIEFNQAISYVNKIKKRFANDERVYKAFLEILNMYRQGKKGIYRVYEEVSVLFGDHPDLLKEFTYFLPDSQPPPQLTVAVKKSSAKSKESKGSKRKASSKASKDEDDKKVKLSLASLSKELQFFEKVKNRLRNKEAYQDFLKCLNIFSQEIISKMELQGLVYDIIGKYSELVQGFNDFLSRCESMDLDLSVKNILGKDGKALDAARASVSSKDMQQKLKAISMRERYNTRPISDLDLTMCELCTPSYRKLPKDYPKMSFSGRNNHKSSQLKTMWTGMLNDQWVSLPTGSEDAYGFKSLRRNQYEEALFRCEDDRFELEMCIECNSATIKVLEPYMNQIPTLSDEKKRSFVLPDDLLGPIHTRSIEKIYAEHGQNILELLRRIPGYAVPMVFERLMEKDKEWRHVQSEMNKVWSKVYEQNYHKSLDHRSFYFKQIDKKNLSSKGIVSEIKELSEERKKNQDMKTKLSKAIATIPDSKWTDQHMDVDIVFDCQDQSIHDEIYGIVSYAADEMLSADLSEKVTTFWCEFYEPFFGLPKRKPEERRKNSEESNEEENEAGDKEDEVMEDKEGEGSEEDKKSSEEKKGDKSGGIAKEGKESEEDGNEEDDSKDKEEEEEDDEEESDPSLEFVNCKPLAAHLALPSAGKKANGRSNLKANSVFYGNDAFYILFRLHHYLYERISISKECAKSGDNKWRPSPQRRSESKQSNKPKEVEAVVAEKNHEEFLQLLYRLIDGTTDVSQYEDECRHLLGAKAYILFTVDKLIYKLVKQIQSIVTDDLLMKLQSLYNYERERKDNLFDDSVYYANSLVLLNEETSRFRIGVMGQGKVSAQILDAAVNKCDIPAVAMDKAFSDYLKNYVEFDSSISAYEHGKIFLTRTLQGIKDMNETDEHLSGALKKFYIFNGLECKVACNTSKVSYVLDTEDILLRKGGFHGKGTTPEQSAKRKERFEKWIEAESAKEDMEED